MSKPLTVKSAAKTKFEAVCPPTAEFCSRDEWAALYATVIASLEILTKDADGLAQTCAKEPEAFLGFCKSLDDHIERYRDLVKLLKATRARLTVGLSRVAVERKEGRA